MNMAVLNNRLDEYEGTAEDPLLQIKVATLKQELNDKVAFYEGSKFWKLKKLVDKLKPTKKS